MPSVPVYRKQVEERGIPAVRVDTDIPAEAFNVGPSFNRVVDSATRFAGGVADVVAREQERADKVRYDQSRVALNEWERNNIYDAEKGAAGTVGEQAFGIDKTLNDSYQKFVSEHRKTLANDRQREAFDGLATERWDHVAKWTQQHIARQKDVVEESAYVAGLESSKDRAATDPTTIPMELAQIGDTILERYRGKLPTEAIQQELQKHETDLHDRVISAYLANGQDAVANDYFEKNMGRIDKDKHPGIKEKIRVGAERIKKQSIEKIEQSALNIIEQTKDFDKIPPTVVAALPRESRTALRAYAKAVSRGETVETDLETYYGLIRMSNEELKKVNLIGLKDKLSPTDWKKWADIQGGLRGGRGDGSVKSPVLDGYRTDQQIVNDVLSAAGIDPTPSPKSGDAKRVAAFRKSVDDKVMELQTRTGKKATNEDIQKIAEGLIMKGAVDGTGLFGFWKKEKFAFEADPGDNLKAEFDDIPENDVIDLRAAAAKRGLPVDDDSIAEYYNRKLRKNVNGR